MQPGVKSKISIEHTRVVELHELHSKRHLKTIRKRLFAELVEQLTVKLRIMGSNQAAALDINLIEYLMLHNS